MSRPATGVWALGALVLAVVCCAAPVLFATGIAAAAGGALADCWPLVLIGVVTLTVFVMTQRRARTASPVDPVADSPVANDSRRP